MNKPKVILIIVITSLLIIAPLSSALALPIVIETIIGKVRYGIEIQPVPNLGRYRDADLTMPCEEDTIYHLIDPIHYDSSTDVSLWLKNEGDFVIIFTTPPNALEPYSADPAPLITSI